MDGSEVTVVLLGDKGVGKTTFVEHCFDGISSGPRLSLHARAQICGREIRIQMVESPRRDQLIPAIMVILLFDLTSLETFQKLEQLVEMAQRVSPVALRAVVGTKADLLEERAVLTQDALRFCQQGEPKMLYYETSVEHGDSILLAFQEIMARPLINEYVIKTTTEQEQRKFVREVMEWAIMTNSANILSHLRQLGYPIPLDIIEKYPDVIRDYLIGEYPLREVARFKEVELKELRETFSWEDSSLMDMEEEAVLTIQDIRPTIHVARNFHLCWRDISLATFLPAFLDKDALSTPYLTHVDLSFNKIPSLPLQLFQLPLLESLDTSHNLISSLPPLELWRAESALQVLNVSYNHLHGDGCASGKMGKRVCPNLWQVDISHNLLSQFPPFLLNFSLTSLNLSHNPAITSLPLELAHMDRLDILLLDGLSLVDPPTLVLGKGPKAILQYLKLKLESQTLWSSVRVVVIGPHRSGKTTLVSKLMGCSTSSKKALQVLEWKYRGNEIFSFRNKWLTLDLWDFSGAPDLEFVYFCFSCTRSLHLVVCDAREGVHSLATWLSDIQSVCEERVPVMVVFTHMDMLKTREDKEKFKKTCVQWITFHNKQGGNGLFSLMATTSVRSLQGEDSSMLASYEMDPMMQDALELQDVKGPDISLMPLVLKVHFLNCLSGEGINNLRKTLYKIVSGSSSAHLPRVPIFLPRDVPQLYVQVESLLRQLRVHNRRHQEGKQQVFYSTQELMGIFKKPLHQIQCSEENFVAALQFIGQTGTVLVHTLPKGQLLVCVDPQMVGCLLQRTMQYCRHTQEEGGNPGTILVAATHLCMMWGVEPVLSMQDSHAPPTPHQVTTSQLLHFLCQLKIFAYIQPGAMLLTPVLPHTLPRSCDPDPTSLLPRRSYVFSYLPSFFHMHVLALLVGGVVKELAYSSPPASPNQTLPPTSIPIKLPSGAELYLWLRNLFVIIPEQSVNIWVRVRVTDVGLDPLPSCGRIDLHLACPDVQVEARWLMILTKQIDTLIQEGYPGLLDSSRPQKIEIFVPLVNRPSPSTSSDSTGTDGENFDLSVRNVGSPQDTLPNESSSSSMLMPKVSEELVQKLGDRPEAKVSTDLSGCDTLAEGGRGTSPTKHVQDVATLRLADGSFSRFITTSAMELTVMNNPRRRYSDLPAHLGSSLDHPTAPRRFSDLPTSTSEKPPNYPHKHVHSNPSTSTMSRPDPTMGPLGFSHRLSSPTHKQGEGLQRLSQVLASTQISSSSRRDSDQPAGRNQDSSWEVLSKLSTTSHRLSIRQDQSNPHNRLVPLWECLQEAFLLPVILVDNSRIVMSELVPDQLFSDLSPNILFRSKESHPGHYLVALEDRVYGGVAPPTPEASGLFVRSYYSFDHDDDILVRKPAGALKAFFLQSRLKLLREDMLKLQSLSNPHFVTATGLQFCPPCLALEAAPFGSLHSWMRRLRRKMCRVDTHQIALQLLCALDFFHSRSTSYHSISSDAVLVWNLDPLVVKLSDVGITHKDCQLCSYLNCLPSDHSNIKSYRLDYMCLGLLVYEMATGKRPYGNIYSLPTVVLAILNDKIKLNIEADHFLQKQGLEDGVGSECIATGCQRLCLQSCIDLCLYSPRVSQEELEARFRLCAGDHQWSPMRLLVNVEAIVPSGNCDGLVYWASGSRGLVTGEMSTSSGILSFNLLQAPPTAESGLFAHRRGRPVPIAVGRASSMAMVQETKQLWVGTENGQKGSVYVFNLPDMRRHHNIHLQDAVLSLCAVNRTATSIGPDSELRFRVLVGLANGTIIVFLGQKGGKVLENPLQGPKFVVMTPQRKPCLAMILTQNGELWCSCGQTLEVYDVISLKHSRKLTPGLNEATPTGRTSGTLRGDVITLMSVNGRGVCTVGRRSSTVRLWDLKSGAMKASFNVTKVIRGSVDSDITSLLMEGGALWLGTRDGYLLLLDLYSMLEGREPLLGLQYCGFGKVKCIAAIGSASSSKLQVVCSLEFQDEVSCLVISWEYFPKQHSRKLPLHQMAPLSYTLPDLTSNIPDLAAALPDLASGATPEVDSNTQYCKSF